MDGPKLSNLGDQSHLRLMPAPITAPCATCGSAALIDEELATTERLLRVQELIEASTSDLDPILTLVAETLWQILDADERMLMSLYGHGDASDPDIELLLEAIDLLKGGLAQQFILPLMRGAVEVHEDVLGLVRHLCD